MNGLSADLIIIDDILEPGELHRFDGKPHPNCCKPCCTMETLHFVGTLKVKHNKRKNWKLYHNRYKCIGCGLVHDIVEDTTH